MESAKRRGEDKTKTQAIHLPIMIGSMLDPRRDSYSPETDIGYFIINGNDCCIPFKEKLIANRVFSFAEGVVRIFLSPPDTPWIRYYVEINHNKSTTEIFGTFSKSVRLRLCQQLFDRIPSLFGLQQLISGSPSSTKRQIERVLKSDLNASCLDGIIPLIPDIISKLTIRDNLDDRNFIENVRLVGTDWILGHSLSLFEQTDNKKSLKQIIVTKFNEMKRASLHRENHFDRRDILSHVRRSENSFGAMTMRELHSSQIGVYCALRVSESENVGILLSLASQVKINIVDGSMESGNSFFGYAANQLPFVRHQPGNRSSLAAKHVTQALNLINPQKPCVLCSICRNSSIIL